jgi:parallel beta-helix repeat protein
MRNVFIIILLTLSTIVSATDYYISSSGDDTNNNGLSSSAPWKTIAKVNSVFSSLKPGDRVLFNKGDTFFGTLIISASGVSGNPILISSYGSGDSPIITGFTTLSSWTNYGGGIYSKVINCASPIEVVTLNGVQYGMGRFPDATWNAIDSRVGSTTITDADLNDAITDWTGAEVVIRGNDWAISRNKITDHTNHTLTYTSANGLTPPVGNGYFIQKDLRCLTTYGEWYYDSGTSTLYMYFGIVDPNSKNVKVTTIDDLVTFASRIKYITIDNVSFKGANKRGIYSYHCDYLIVQNCDIDFTGLCGIMIYVSIYDLVLNTTINHSNEDGILSAGGCDNLTVRGCTVNNSGMILGLGNSTTGTSSNMGMVLWQGNNIIVENNIVKNSSYNGISILGNNIIIRNNFVYNFCIFSDDGGGIYYGGESTYKNMLITNNIVLNGIGAPNGKSSGVRAAVGIYLDYGTTGGVEISNNTIAYCTYTGIYLHSSQNVKIVNNNIFDCNEEMRFQEFLGYGTPTRNVTMNNNIFFSKSVSQVPLFCQSYNNDFDQFGTFDNNYYVRPLDNEKPIYPLISWTGTLKSLPQWQTLYGKDLNSKISPITLTDTADIDFFYNETTTDKVFTLVQPMIDVKGSQYISTVTLAPFTSVVLMVDPNPPVPVIPVYVNSIIQNSTPTKLEITYSVNLDPGKVPSVSDFLVKGTTGSVTAVTISGTKVILTLSAAVAFGDVITLSYSPGTIPLQTPSLGKATSLTDKAVTNNLVDPTIPNDPPVIAVNYSENAYSGFVYELDASGTTDSNNDILTYTWTTPSNIPVSITTGPKIKFLSPIVTKSEVIDFGLSVNDGKATQSKSLSITLNPYKPELGLAKSSTIAASNYYLTDYPNNVIDGDLTTKWSANGDNHWLLLSLSEPFKISHLQVALLPDQKYESYFDIYVSKDNSIWEPVLIKNATCNFSGAMQTFDFPAAKTGTEYSFVKLIGHGNSLNTWNNYSELKLFGSIGESSNGSTLNPGNISIYPNPASDLINILILEPPSESQSLRIYDMTGAMRFESQIDPGVNNVQIPINLNSGIYIAEVMLGKLIMFAQKLLVIK